MKDSDVRSYKLMKKLLSTDQKSVIDLERGKLYINGKWFIAASIIVAIIITLGIASSSIALFSPKAEAATVPAAASMGATSNVTKNQPVEGYDSPQGSLQL